MGQVIWDRLYCISCPASPALMRARRTNTKPLAQLISLLLETAPALGEIPSVPEKVDRYQSALTRYKTTPCDGTTALMAPPVFSIAPVHRLCVE